MCDEIFGRMNFINNVIWEKKYSPQNDAKWLSDSHDFIIVYAKNKQIWRPKNIKLQIKEAQHRAVLSANQELIRLYWNIGAVIVQNGHWGNKFVENLARDIKLEFPNTTGYSVRNLKYMQKFAKMFTKEEFVQEPLAQILWYHHITLMDKVKEKERYLWYVRKTAENGWSRNVLVHQIELRLYERQALADKTTNFKERLPLKQSELAQQSLKDPYVFDFIEPKEALLEREIENELVSNITKLLLELGTGFAFINQYNYSYKNY